MDGVGRAVGPRSAGSLCDVLFRVVKNQILSVLLGVVLVRSDFPNSTPAIFPARVADGLCFPLWPASLCGTMDIRTLVE